MKKIKFDRNSLFQIGFSFIITFLFLLAIFPLTKVCYLLFISFIFICLLVLLLNKLNERPIKTIALRKRYLIEKLIFGIMAIFLNISAVSCFVVLIVFGMEGQKDIYGLWAMIAMGFLGGLCFCFGFPLTREFFMTYKSYEQYLVLRNKNEFEESHHN